MSETKHTPTPWAVHSTFTNVIVPCDQRSRPLGASVDEDVDRERYAVLIATVERDKLSSFAHERTRAEADANAKLIVCAVNSHADLLEALETIAAWPFDIRGDCVADARKLAQAAIAKAKGEQL
jgi:hypothetical protein